MTLEINQLDGSSSLTRAPKQTFAEYLINYVELTRMLYENKMASL